MANDKLFFWKDKSGRGFASPMTEQDLREWETEDTDWNGKTLTEFLEEAEVGENWENAANEITRTV